MSDLSKWESRQTILVTEDDAIVGLDLTDILEAAGYRIAGPVNNSAEALEWLKTNVPDAVVLDLVLKDGSCTEIVRELRSRRIPFLIYSGRRQHQADVDLSDAKWLEKPAAHHDILTALARLLQDPPPEWDSYGEEQQDGPSVAP